MATTLTLTPKNLKNVTRPSSTKPSHLYEVAEKINQLSIIVEDDWDSLTEETQHFLRCMTYDNLNPQTQFSLKRAWGRIKFLWFLTFSDDMAVFQWHSAVVRLNESVLDAIEFENDKFKEDLSKALDLEGARVGQGRRVR